MRTPRSTGVFTLAMLFAVGSAHAFVTDGLVGYWPFDADQVSGNTAMDMVGNSDGVAIDGSLNLTSGKVGDALDFDGQVVIEVSECTAADDALEGSPSFTIEFWALVEGDGQQGWVGKGIGADSQAVRIRADPQSWALHFWNNDWNPDPVIPADRGNWQHLAFTFDGGTLEGNIYANGTLAGSHTYGPVDFQSSVLWFGREMWDGANRPSGALDEVRLYDRVLSETEVVTNMETLTTAVSPAGKTATVWGALKR
ncbi:MAG: LamG domain-containing protein [Candidatus Poribacteria bacterium]|nr:LamG domain-containing protein [Candidatus Poribacteria bacterium]